MVQLSANGLFAILTILVTSLASFYFTVWPVAFLVILRLCIRVVPSIFLRPFTVWYDYVEQQWMGLVVILLECVLKLRLAYTIVSTSPTAPSQLSDVFKKPQRGKFKLIILNHRSRIDWLMMFPFFARAGSLSTLKIVLKAELRKIPIFGWSMQLFRFIFLTRKWSNDEAKIRSLIRHYHESGGATIMIFPEGTDLSESNIEKSRAYAEKNNLPSFRHVLNPRTTGFVAMKNMIGAENIEEIIDVTMGYTDFVAGERPSEVSIVNGRMPKKVHILCTRHVMAENANSEMRKGTLDPVPVDDDNLHQWVNGRFAIKEILLSFFYTNNPVGFEPHRVREVLGENCSVFTYDEDADASRKLQSTKFLQFVRDVGIWRGFIFIILLWGAPVVYWVFFARLLTLLFFGMHLCMCYWIVAKKGGLDQWLFLDHQQQQKEKKEPEGMYTKSNKRD